MRLPPRRTLLLLAVLYAMTALGGIAFAIVLSRDIPGLEQLSALELPQSTILLDRNGERFSSFAEQRRTSVPLSRMSPWLVKGLLATEDPRFYDHVGIDPQAIARALVYSALSLDWGAEGGSTITQQLARGIWLHPQKTVSRKLREAVLAALLEKRYSKDEILELYANRIYLGHGNYGFEAAAHFFFDKGAADVSLAEAAMLAGLPQRPESLSPIKNPERALRRRNHVLDRMVREGYLDGRLAAAAKKAPIGLVKPSPRAAEATYFVEEVRRRVARQFGDSALYRDGLVVETTLDPA
ncbi:MAG: mrcA, partial [Acidobacteria bacterium]|nr:mrcA [Acidobacteriota bacterium]